ncbi:MAG TPA: UvrD-helicase domain-containing protein, partial [Vitreimonas sp.]|nr:UvrD-helicase domain-containing protein [Vitreimonas sp.]
MHASVADRLARLAPDQRAAATAPRGPVLCVAPAGSGKTTTLVARVAWLVDGGVDPATIAAITFNKRAADELAERLGSALEPLGVSADAVRVRTFHALGLEILRSDGVSADLVDRSELLAELAPGLSAAVVAGLDTAFSRLKLDLRADVDAVDRDPEAGATAHAWVAYERALAARGVVDFDDLVRRALERLEGSPALLARWRASCSHLLVDEAQDLD